MAPSQGLWGGDWDLVGNRLFFPSIALILGFSFVVAYLVQATPLPRIVWPAAVSEGMLVLLAFALIHLLPRFPLRRSAYLLLGTGLVLFFLGMLQEVMEEVFGPVHFYPLFEYIFLPLGVALVVAGAGLSILLAQREASEIDHRYRELTEGLSEVVYRAEPESLAPVSVNSAAEGLFGRSVAELTKQPETWFRAVHPEDRDTVVQRLRRARSEGNPVAMEYRVVRPDDHIRWVEDRVGWEKDERGWIRSMKGVIYDITERKEAEESLRRERDFSQALLENMPGLFFLIDQQGRLRFWNRTVERVTGYESADIRRMAPYDLFPAEPGGGLDRALKQGRESGHAQVETTLRTAGGEDIPYTLEARRVHVAGEPHWVAFGLDLSHHKEYQAEIERLAYWDSTTGLPNWTFLIEELERELARARENNRIGGLLFLDIDNFKSINDSLGHVTGDELLRELTQRLASCIRPTDLVARIGGDEFAILLPELGQGEDRAAVQAEQVVTRLQEGLRRPMSVGGRDLIISSALGIALFPQQGETASDLIQKADTALYEAKAKGKGEHTFFQPEMLRAAQEQLHLEQELRQAFEAGDLALHYQPIVELPGGDWMGFEALLRWHHPTEGWISPARFVPVAEQSGLIRRLGEWVLRQGLEQWRDWEDQMGSPLPFGLSVNVSPFQFGQPQFVNQVRGILEETGVQPDRICLELTESALLEDPEGATEKILSLHRIGLRIAIDDFGTGYSSLSYLKQLPIRTIKIDKSFVQDLTDNPNSQVLVQTILAMAENLGMSVVAEGVEDPGEADWLHRHRCAFAQGFLYSRPMPFDQIRSQLLAT